MIPKLQTLIIAIPSSDEYSKTFTTDNAMPTNVHSHSQKMQWGLKPIEPTETVGDQRRRRLKRTKNVTAVDEQVLRQEEQLYKLII